MADVEVEIDTGKLRGTTEKNVYNNGEYISFKGIPYAEPPVGQLRFEDPQALRAWSGVRDASRLGNNCAHIDPLTRQVVGSDDCLYLNVYTTSIQPESLKAVMVWIHGGAFVLGSGDDTFYGPDYLIVKDIVLVTINYRVGILGFLNLEDPVAAGNQGLKDQVFALEWVKRNIDKFGGDPNNVTIFGESAGGASVHYLAISPLAQGLFHKAILQSGVATNPWANIPGSPKRFAQRIVRYFGKETDDPVEILNFLRNIDVHELILAQSKINTKIEKLKWINPFGPGADTASKNPFLPSSLDEAIKTGIQVPCIIGHVNDEGLIAASGPLVPDVDADPAAQGANNRKFSDIEIEGEHSRLHPTAVEYLKRKNISIQDIKKLYFGNENISKKNIKRYFDLQGDLHFLGGIHEIIELQIEKSKSPTYLYNYDYDEGPSMVKLFLNINVPGTCHADEIPLLFCGKFAKKFGMNLPEPLPTHKLLIERFTELWTNFAKTGNPTPSTSELLPVKWIPVNNTRESYNCLHITDRLEMTKEMNTYHRMAMSLKNKL